MFGRKDKDKRTSVHPGSGGTGSNSDGSTSPTGHGNSGSGSGNSNSSSGGDGHFSHSLLTNPEFVDAERPLMLPATKKENKISSFFKQKKSSANVLLDANSSGASSTSALSSSSSSGGAGNSASAGGGGAAGAAGGAAGGAASDQFIHGLSKKGKKLIGTDLVINNQFLKVERAIAEGFTSHIFTTIDQANGQKYALKLVEHSSPGKKAMAFREIDALTSCQSERNVIKVIASANVVDEKHEATYILEEYSSNGSFQDIFDRTHLPLSVEQVLAIFCDVVEQVARLHTRNPPIFHRDLRLANVLLGDDGCCKLCDFGSSCTQRSRWDGSNTVLLSEDILQNVPLAIRAPEMIKLKSQAIIGEKADVWALGCLLYHLCYMSLPFETADKILKADFTIPNATHFDYSPLTPIFGMTLTVKPDDRFSAGELLKFLKALPNYKAVADHGDRQSVLAQIPKDVRATRHNVPPSRSNNTSTNDLLEAAQEPAPPIYGNTASITAAAAASPIYGNAYNPTNSTIYDTPRSIKAASSKIPTGAQTPAESDYQVPQSSRRQQGSAASVESDYQVPQAARRQQEPASAVANSPIYGNLSSIAASAGSGNNSSNNAAPATSPTSPTAEPPHPDLQVYLPSLFATRQMLQERMEKLQQPRGNTNGFGLEYQAVVEEAVRESKDKGFRLVGSQFASRNRYVDILPFEHSIVKLRQRAEKGEVDYINACIMRNLAEKCPDFVATQGPLPSTIDDFWLLVWEQRSMVIVMLTLPVQGGREKCAKYWPESGDTLNTGDFSITCRRVQDKGDKLLRTLVIKQKETGDQRVVYQFHYVSWPDYDVPDTPHSLCNFVTEVDEATRQLKTTSPLIVHCSAGVGRSGTFILIFALLYELRNNVGPNLNIMNLVRAMRRRRMAMIQTASQYIFCYQAACYLCEKLEERLREAGITAPPSSAPPIPSSSSKPSIGLGASFSSAASSSSSSSSSSSGGAGRKQPTGKPSASILNDNDDEDELDDDGSSGSALSRTLVDRRAANPSAMMDAFVSPSRDPAALNKPKQQQQPAHIYGQLGSGVLAPATTNDPFAVAPVPVSDKPKAFSDAKAAGAGAQLSSDDPFADSGSFAPPAVKAPAPAAESKPPVPPTSAPSAVTDQPGDAPYAQLKKTKAEYNQISAQATLAPTTSQPPLPQERPLASGSSGSLAPLSATATAATPSKRSKPSVIISSSVAITPPLHVKHLAEMTRLSISRALLLNGTLSIQSDRFVTLLTKKQPEAASFDSLTCIDLVNPRDSARNNITAEQALLHPFTKVVALRFGIRIHVFDMVAKSKVASCIFRDAVLFWTWATPSLIVIVTQDSVFHWPIRLGASGAASVSSGDPVKILEHGLNAKKVLGYVCSESENDGDEHNVTGGEWHALTVRNPTDVCSTILFAPSKSVQAFVDASAVCFVSMRTKSATSDLYLACVKPDDDDAMFEQVSLLEACDDVDTNPIFRLNIRVPTFSPGSVKIPIPGESGPEIPDRTLTVAVADKATGSVLVTISNKGIANIFDVRGGGKHIHGSRLVDDGIIASTHRTRSSEFALTCISGSGLVLSVGIEPSSLAGLLASSPAAVVSSRPPLLISPAVSTAPTPAQVLSPTIPAAAAVSSAHEYELVTPDQPASKPPVDDYDEVTPDEPPVESTVPAKQSRPRDSAALPSESLAAAAAHLAATFTMPASRNSAVIKDEYIYEDSGAEAEPPAADQKPQAPAEAAPAETRAAPPPVPARLPSASLLAAAPKDAPSTLPAVPSRRDSASASAAKGAQELASDDEDDEPIVPPAVPPRSSVSRQGSMDASSAPAPAPIAEVPAASAPSALAAISEARSESLSSSIASIPAAVEEAVSAEQPRQAQPQAQEPQQEIYATNVNNATAASSLPPQEIYADQVKARAISFSNSPAASAVLSAAVEDTVYEEFAAPLPSMDSRGRSGSSGSAGRERSGSERRASMSKRSVSRVSTDGATLDDLRAQFIALIQQEQFRDAAAIVGLEGGEPLRKDEAACAAVLSALNTSLSAFQYFVALVEYTKLLDAAESNMLADALLRRKRAIILERLLREEQLTSTVELGDKLRKAALECVPPLGEDALFAMKLALLAYSKCGAINRIVETRILFGDYEGALQFMSTSSVLCTSLPILASFISWSTPELAVQLATTQLAHLIPEHPLRTPHGVATVVDMFVYAKPVPLVTQGIRVLRHALAAAGDLREDSELQTRLMELVLSPEYSYPPSVDLADHILHKNMLSYFSRLRVAKLCEAAGMGEWALRLVLGSGLAQHELKVTIPALVAKHLTQLSHGFLHEFLTQKVSLDIRLACFRAILATGVATLSPWCGETRSSTALASSSSRAPSSGAPELSLTASFAVRLALHMVEKDGLSPISLLLMFQFHLFDEGMFEFARILSDRAIHPKILEVACEVGVRSGKHAQLFKLLQPSADSTTSRSIATAYLKCCIKLREYREVLRFCRTSTVLDGMVAKRLLIAAIPASINPFDVPVPVANATSSASGLHSLGVSLSPLLLALFHVSEVGQLMGDTVFFLVREGMFEMLFHYVTQLATSSFAAAWIETAVRTMLAMEAQDVLVMRLLNSMTGRLPQDAFSRLRERVATFYDERKKWEGWVTSKTAVLAPSAAGSATLGKIVEGSMPLDEVFTRIASQFSVAQVVSFLASKSNAALWTRALQSMSKEIVAYIFQQGGFACFVHPPQLQVVVQAFLGLKLERDLLAVLEAVLLRNYSFSSNGKLENLLLTFAMKNNTKLFRYLASVLDQYDPIVLADVAVQIQLFEEAILVYKKHGMHVAVVRTLLKIAPDGLKRAMEYAHVMQDPILWSLINQEVERRNGSQASSARE